jgi:hypothetical protein
MISPEAASPTSSRTARSPEELFPLIDFCRAGKLKEVSEWVAAGKPLDPPISAKRKRRSSPLEVAIEKGFYSLTELLLDGGCDPLANGNALYDAVVRDEPEIARLLLERGVPVDSVDMSVVFEAGRAMLEVFIAKGADPSANSAYYEALCSKVHPLLFLLKDFKERFPDLQQQADMALCHHCERESPRNVGLLVWAGARPDAEVPDPNMSDYTTCALKTAVRSGRLDIIKQLKPQNYPATIPALISEVWSKASIPLIDFLVGLGAPLNNRANGGCDIIEHLLWRLGFDARGVFGHSDPATTTNCLSVIEHLCRLGAKWVPDADEPIRRTRDRFRKMQPQHLRELFRIFKETNAAPVELLDSILNSPALKKSLGGELRSIEAILHPPPAKQSNASDSDRAEAPKARAKPLPPTVAKIRACAVEMLLDVVRQEPALHFTTNSTSEHYEGKKIKKQLGMPAEDDRDVKPIVNQASQELNARLRSFQTQIEWWGRANCRMTATLSGSAEWPAALEEAWGFADNPNEALLTDTARNLRELILAGDIGTDWTTEKSITSKIGLYGREHVLEPYLQELENKTGLPLKWESEGKRWGETRRYRITVNNQADSEPYTGIGINPKIDVRFDERRKADRDAVQELLYRELLRAKPIGKEPFFLVSISTRTELQNCFPKFASGQLAAQFFHELPIHASLTRSFDFRDNAKRWFVAFAPKQDWATSLAAIESELSQPGLAQRFGISADAAKLLTWIEGLPADRFTGPWTPVVEEARDRWIGISCPWGEENFPAYLQMLTDEINQHTAYDLAVQPWHQHGKLKSRVRVGRKRTRIEDVVKHVQWLAFDQGVVLDARAAQNSIEELLRQSTGTGLYDDQSGDV